MKNWFKIFIIFSGLFSCNPEKITSQNDKDGVITSLPYKWKSRISDGVLGYGLYHGYVINNMGVLCLSMRKSTDPKIYGEFYLELKDINSGKNIWVWDEFYDKTLKRTLNRSIVTFENKMIVHDVLADYCIDTATGKTVWKKQREYGSAAELNSIEGRFFISGLSPESKAQKKVDDSIFEGDFNTGEISEIVKPAYDVSNAQTNQERTYIGSIYRHLSYKSANENMLLVPFDEIGTAGKYNSNRSFFGLYNLNKKEWAYKRAPLSLEEDGSTPSLMPIIKSDKVYLTSLNSVGCFDLTTGNRIWQYRLSQNQMTALDMVLEDNKIVVNGTDGTIYCMNASTGAVLWSSPSSAMSSDLFYQDGIIYGIRGTTLRAMDIQSGKLLWDMPSLDSKVENRSDSWYGGFVTGVKGKESKKGKIYATTNLNLYCFEAVN